MKKLLILLAIGAIISAVLIFSGSSAFAGIPHLINYQGMLTDNSGTPLTDTVNIIFKIYDNSSGGNLKWQETQNNVPVINGLFNVLLGSVTPIDTLSFSQQYWLDITVDGEQMPSRLKFTSVGYAYRAQKSDTASVAMSAPSGGGWTDDGGNVRLTTNTDKVGIGVTIPLGKLHINTSGWDAAHLYLEAPSYGHSRILQANDGLLIKNFYATGTNTAFSFRNPTDVHLLDIRADGNVGIGMTAPSEKLQVAGTVHSTSGGFKFPDGTTQATAASGAGGGWTDGGTKLYLTTSTDTVGIGTNGPHRKLHITEDVNGLSYPLKLENPNTNFGTGTGILFSGGGGTNARGKGGLVYEVTSTWNRGKFHFLQNPGGDANNPTLADAVMTIQNDGNVGIGTTNPSYKFDVRGNRIQLKEDATGDWMAMRTDGDALDFQFQGGNLYLQSTTAGENILLNPTTSSNVGIGTTTPGTKLDVASSSGTAIRATVTSASGWGIEASAKEGGAHIGDADGTGHAYIGHGNTGCEAYGNEQGGYFQDGDNGAYAHVGYGNRGIDAGGTEAGGHFVNGLGDGEAFLGYRTYSLDIGVQAKGGTYGGYFESPDAGGGFDNTSSSGWAWVAWGDKKITGSGACSFVQNHPLNNDQVIIYTAPEGDEVATYTRGTTRLVNGEARVKLGETFKWVTNPDIGLTAHLTPRGDCKGLYVASLTTSEMVVKELQSGTSDVTFDYLVYGLRIGFEEVSVVHEKPREAYIPSMAIYRELYNKYPELRHFNALERFREMNTQIGKPFDLGASRALRDAIHEFDPAIDKIPEPPNR